jgi:hypothetical protein
MPDREENIEELQKNFYLNAITFFGWNSGKNTPNILDNLQNQILQLNSRIQESNTASIQLSKSLNKITLSGVIVSASLALLALLNFIK